MNERKHGTTLEEVEAAGGTRNPKSKRWGLNKLVDHFLGVALEMPEGIENKAQYKQREAEAEMRGFYKAQEHLREIIAMGGTDAIAALADVRNEKQQRPVMIGNFRTWLA